MLPSCAACRPAPFRLGQTSSATAQTHACSASLPGCALYLTPGTPLLQTAVNFHGRKNKMGTYCPPLAVFIDNAFLASLEQRHLSNGSAEILKMACIKDAALFELLEKHAAELLRTNFQVGHQHLWEI